MGKQGRTRVEKTLQALLEQDTLQAARMAKLRYVNDDEAGIQRKAWGRGFTFIDANGNHIQDAELRARCQELAIPPAWTEVWICADQDGHIQATGRDSEGRKQYIYHERWEEVRSQSKFNRLALFGYTLPLLRAQVDRDLRRHNFPFERMVALVVYLLDKTYIRIGNIQYAAGETYGLTTLLTEHLTVSGSTLQFNFTGKSGKEQEIELRDRRLARLIERCQELPGQHLFIYEDEDGAWRRVTSSDVNEYLRQHMGRAFSAKEFRTWGATVTAAEVLLALVAQDAPPEESHVNAAVEAAAEALGNTVTVCRNYYVHPIIGESYLAGKLHAVDVPHEGLSLTETAVLNVLLATLKIAPEELADLFARDGIIQQ